MTTLLSSIVLAGAPAAVSLFWPALGAAVLISIAGFLAGVAGGRLIWGADRIRARELEESISNLRDEIRQLERTRVKPRRPSALLRVR